MYDVGAMESHGRVLLRGRVGVNAYLRSLHEKATKILATVDAYQQVSAQSGRLEKTGESCDPLHNFPCNYLDAPANDEVRP